MLLINSLGDELLGSKQSLQRIPGMDGSENELVAHENESE